jgi:hypothetical protein
MAVPKAPSVGVTEVHVSVKRSRDYQAVEVSATAALEPGSDEGAALGKIDELFALLAEDAERRVTELSGAPAAAPQPSAAPQGAAELLSRLTDDDAPAFHDNEAWAAKTPAPVAQAPAGVEFLFANKPDKAKGPKQFRYLPATVMSKRELEDASKRLAAAKGFPEDQLIAFDNRDRLDQGGWGACVVKARRGSELAGRLGDRDTVGFTAWSAEGNLVIDVWAKI